MTDIVERLNLLAEDDEWGETVGPPAEIKEAASEIAGLRERYREAFAEVERLRGELVAMTEENERRDDLQSKSIESLMTIGKALGVPELPYDEAAIVAAALQSAKGTK